MRCLSCNDVLSDREATRRIKSTGEFLDFCDTCYSSIKEEVPTVERVDLEASFIDEESQDSR